MVQRLVLRVIGPPRVHRRHGHTAADGEKQQGDEEHLGDEPWPARDISAGLSRRGAPQQSAIEPREQRLDAPGHSPRDDDGEQRLPPRHTRHGVGGRRGDEENRRGVEGELPIAIERDVRHEAHGDDEGREPEVDPADDAHPAPGTLAQQRVVAHDTQDVQRQQTQRGHGGEIARHREVEEQAVPHHGHRLHEMTVEQEEHRLLKSKNDGPQHEGQDHQTDIFPDIRVTVE